MISREAQQEHQRWFARYKSDESADIPVLCMFKAIRNFVQPLTMSRKKPMLLHDYRAEATVAIGDMLMYVCAYAQCNNLDVCDVEKVKNVAASVEQALACLTIAMSFALDVHTPSNSTLALLANAVLQLANVCCIDVEEAARASLKKLPC